MTDRAASEVQVYGEGERPFKQRTVLVHGPAKAELLADDARSGPQNMLIGFCGAHFKHEGAEGYVTLSPGGVAITWRGREWVLRLEEVVSLLVEADKSPEGPAPMGVLTRVPLQRVADLLCSALEGGSNYWYTIKEFKEPPEIIFRCDEKRIYWPVEGALNEGGALIFISNEEPERNPATFDLAAAQRGLQLMADKYPRHWADFLEENDDATTGDVFLQLALYGEVLYG